MLKVNGQDFPWEEKMTINLLLQRKKYTYPGIIVSVNGRVLAEDEYDIPFIQDGDDIKVLHLVAGG
ncbi:MAG: sulfur carrier protein ThiS [Negativicutes bacterium]|nr:sulfur carrier protein ThiS [Negativicutes bacterium]